MAGNCSVACAMGFLSLARKRRKVRVDSKTSLRVPALHLHPLPLPKERGENAMHAFTLRVPLDQATHNILWLHRSKNPPNCVFFACHPPTLTVLTS